MSLLLPENAVEIYRGMSKTLELAVTDAQGKAVDITGSTVHFTVKQDIRDGTATVQKSSASSSQIELTSPRLGIARIYIVPADTQNLDPASYTFDVVLIMPGGKRYLVVPPTALVILPGVTTVAL